MGWIARIAGLITVFGAVNWVVLSLFSTDAIRRLLGSSSHVGHAAMAVVGLSALYVLIEVARPKRRRAS
ncbi:MAG: DUF378 domain-containing protein [Planctomycetota bacterium]|jgi:uncharacterized membrane protein YuzA (DUF378 family)